MFLSDFYKSFLLGVDELSLQVNDNLMTRKDYNCDESNHCEEFLILITVSVYIAKNDFRVYLKSFLSKLFRTHAIKHCY